MNQENHPDSNRLTLQWETLKFSSCLHCWHIFCNKKSQRQFGCNQLFLHASNSNNNFLSYCFLGLRVPYVFINTRLGIIVHSCPLGCLGSRLFSYTSERKYWQHGVISRTSFELPCFFIFFSYTNVDHVLRCGQIFEIFLPRISILFDFVGWILYSFDNM